MTATETALERGYGSGIAVDTELVNESLLVDAVQTTEMDAASEEPDVHEGDDAHPDGGDTSVFETYSEHWYHPDSETYGWAVRTTDGDRRYFKTLDGARERLRSEYA